MTDLERVVAELRRDVEATERLGAELGRVREQVAAVRITESAAGGAVCVTVGENGMLTDVSMTDGIAKLRPEQVAGAVMSAFRKAQAGYPRRLAQIMAESVGDERLTRYIVGAAEARFSLVADDSGAAQPSRPDDDFADKPILRRVADHA
jgi:DNA-binding protein YbaB